MESAGGSCREPAPRRHGLAFRRGGPYPTASFSLRLAAPPFPPLSATGCRGSRRSGWPRGRALRAAPCGALPKCAPRRRRAGTGGRCCRAWNAEESAARQIPPGTACAQKTEDRIHRRAHVGLALPPARLRRAEQRFKELPLRIGKIARQTSPRLFLSLPVRLRPHRESKPPSHPGGGESPPNPNRQKLLGQALRKIGVRVRARASSIDARALAVSWARGAPTPPGPIQCLSGAPLTAECCRVSSRDSRASCCAAWRARVTAACGSRAA